MIQIVEMHVQELAPSAAASQELLHLRSSDPQTGAELCGLSLLVSPVILRCRSLLEAVDQHCLWHVCSTVTASTLCCHNTN